MDYDSVLDLVKKRRSVRKFKPGRIPDEYIDKIIEVARWAPSGFNFQPWDFVVIKSKALRTQLIDILQDNTPKPLKQRKGASQGSEAISPVDRLVMKTPGKVSTFHHASVFIILYGDVRTRVGLPAGERMPMDDMFRFIFDASLANAFMYMHLAATSLGLATQWWSPIRSPEIQARIKPLVGIPEALVAFDMLVLGYPGAVPRPKLLRPKDKMVHIDECGPEDYRTDEEVKDFAERSRAWAIGQHRREYR